MQGIKTQDLLMVWILGFILMVLMVYSWPSSDIYKFKRVTCFLVLLTVIPHCPPSCLHQLESSFCTFEICLLQPGFCLQLCDLHVASWNNWQHCSSLWACGGTQKIELNHLCTSRVLWGSFAILRSWNHLSIFGALVLLKMFLYKEDHASH